MNKKITFAEQVLNFNNKLSHESLDLPYGFKAINPFNGDQKELVKEITSAFYKKYYNDTRSRRLILGSSPSRRGTAITGIPFEDAKHLQSEILKLSCCQIRSHHLLLLPRSRWLPFQSSSGFLYDVMRKYGGCKKFYADFYMNFVCPIGIVRINSRGNEVNCNYYESKKLQKVLYNFIISTIRSQIDFGVDTSVCYCIGSGENYRFLSKINNEYNFFSKIIPLEHPRFIMQYNSKKKDVFIEKYINSLLIK